MKTKDKEQGTSISIYVVDPESYNNIQNDIRQEWYAKYGQALTKSELVMKAMILLRDYLKGSSLYNPDASKKVRPQDFSRVLK